MSLFKQKAIVSKECKFPKCEKCEHYLDVGGHELCNVPMVISKQELLIFRSTLSKMENRIKDIEDVVYTRL